ncbi:phosphate transport system permease protein [Aurantimicrobium minutum]|nr:phosphate transport system permease protein [Aurantimicrobium minutum]MDH6254997.1 phosphate transport system permease protein [Aurantimicrobium minutum]MDH6278571.1 phosphate transport system permease protein [Aurantimicrobium minutum]MDH6409820.1 phosphate transport system permease protein [Aurantimicrobium minutum]MDH6424028.1 phosphate transport system permease protein [Aurantimicrobium minutum]
MAIEVQESTQAKAPGRMGDKVFSTSSLVAGSLILAVLAAVAIFLVAQSLPAFLADPADVNDGQGFWTYVIPLVFGTIWAAALALVIALPFAIGIALFISHFAPRKLAQGLGYVIDLLAAVPSVVFGLWGITVLAPAVQPFYSWLVDNLGWIPLFAGPVSGTGRSILTVAVVLAVMILPIITALSREIFLQTPRLHEEAALALGATRWEMIKVAVLPFGRPGIISATMLGLGRALGETMAVAMVLSPSVIISFALIQSQNPTTIAANIALNFPEAHDLGVNVLIATGLILFLITLLVNSLARMVINRRKAFSGAN